MNPYSSFFRLLEKRNVRDAQSFEAFLSKIPSVYYYPSSANQDDFSLFERFCENLTRRSTASDDTVPESGIHQFSLSTDSRVAADSIRKALFLAKRATIFTTHHVSLSEMHNWNVYDGETDGSVCWHVDPDLLRDVYQHRELLDNGSLTILPLAYEAHRQENTTESGATRTYGSDGTVSLLESIEGVRVFHCASEERVIDRVIARYRKNQQLVSLPVLNVPWIEHAETSVIVRIRQDYDIPLQDFQRAYHQALLDYIENHRTLDFDRISHQINNDLIAPRLQKLERSYKRCLSYHRSLTAAGAAISFIPIAGAVINSALFREGIVDAVAKIGPSAAAGLAAAVAINRLNRERAVEALEDDEFYVLWQTCRKTP